MARPLSKEMKKLHNKFIPANLIICIIALVAGICMILMPWVDIRIHIEGSKLAEMLSNAPSVSAEVSDTSKISAFDSEAEKAEENAEDAIMGALYQFLQDFSMDVPINFRPTNMFKAATGGKEEIAEMLNSVVGKDGAEQLLSDFVNEVAPAVVGATLSATIDNMFNALEKELTKEDLALIQQYKDQITIALENINKDPSTENATIQLNSIADKILEGSGDDISNEDLQVVRDVVDEIVKQGSNEGKFDYLYLVKNLDIDSLEKIITEKTSSAPEITPSVVGGKVVTNGFAKSYETADVGADSSDNPLSAIIELMENPGALIADSLDEQTVATLNTVFLAITIVFIGIPATLCFILALSAIIRIFTQKKRVRFWYVKILLFISGFTILAFNIVANVVLPSLVSSMGAGELASLLGAFSVTFLGSGVVNGICWLALTVVSLFYYRRVKKQISKQKQIEKNANLSVA